MPIVVPKKAKPDAPAASPAPMAADPGITRAELTAILAERDAKWSKALAEVTKMLRDAIPKPEPRKPVKVKFDLDGHGNPEGFTITPEK